MLRGQDSAHRALQTDAAVHAGLRRACFDANHERLRLLGRYNSNPLVDEQTREILARKRHSRVAIQKAFRGYRSSKSTAELAMSHWRRGGAKVWKN